jgi:phytoene desaturase
MGDAIMKVGIIGAGPGGLACGMLLANKGFDVTIYEKTGKVGGRNACIKEQGYTFDVGPTFFLMPFVLEEIFQETGRDLHEYVDMRLVSPNYQLVFGDGTKLFPDNDPEKTKKSIKKLVPGDEKGFERYMKDNDKKMAKAYAALQKPYVKPTDMLRKEVMQMLPVLKPWKSLWQELGDYYSDDRVKLGFTFQSKYLGMSPRSCPSMFSIICFSEYKWGIHHVMGGLNQLAEAMAKAFKEMGGKIRFNTDVKEIKIEDGKAVGVVLEKSVEKLDEVVMNADFAWGMKNLIPDSKRKKYSDKKLNKKKYSCSTFMLYLGLDKVYDELEHHNVFISNDYNQNFEEIENLKIVSKDPSFYVHNPSRMDPSLAPEGHSALYVLVPITNLKSKADWKKETKAYRDLIIKKLKQKAGLKDLEKHIKFEKIVTPLDWQEEYRVGYGATFNLAHNLMQMLFFRPRNDFEEFDNTWLVGGGTHPGSGLPTIYESGRITAKLIAKKHGK